MKPFTFYAAPFFACAILIEWYFTQKAKSGGYLFKDSVTSITLGMGSLFCAFLANFFVIPLFVFISHYRIFDIPPIWSNIFSSHSFPFSLFFLLFLIEDFTYYWFHRISHECRLFWCFHETHHASEYYNFSTALRQSWTGAFFAFVFWIPMAVLGFQIEDIFIQMSVNLVYQFVLHTRYTKLIKYFDFIFNTPSHHRVHHGKNIEYLDKNYAGTLIIWDRIFGTFKKEDKEPTYGVISPPNSFNPFYLGFYMCFNLIKDVSCEKNMFCKLKYIFYPPGWRADGKSTTTKDLQRINSEDFQQISPTQPSM